MKPGSSHQGNGQRGLQKRAPRRKKDSYDPVVRSPAQDAQRPRQQYNSGDYGTTSSSDTLLGLVPAAFTLVCAYDNFQVAFLVDECHGYQELVTGAAQVVICLVYVHVKISESTATWIFPACPANSWICRDTAVIVLISYVLLLDISLSNLWLAVFPAVAIAFIYALCSKLPPPPPPPPPPVAAAAAAGAGGGKLPPNSGNGSIDRKSTERALKAMAAVPFFALLLIAQLKDDVANRFAISQFLLFLSTTLGALAYMMMRLPVCGVTPASELLHKAFLLLFLVTAHAVAAEALGEEEAVVMACAPELLPIIMWFGLHLDGNSSIISLDKMKRPGKYVLGVLATVAIALLAYLATSMGESGLSGCTTILVSCGVSGLLTYYLVFMLRQWPGQQTAAGNIHDVAPVDISLQPKKKGGKGKSTTASSKEAAQPAEQTAASLEEAVQLLQHWAMFLLTVAAALLILKYVVARRLGLQESQLLETFCRNFQRLCW